MNGENQQSENGAVAAQTDAEIVRLLTAIYDLLRTIKEERESSPHTLYKEKGETRRRKGSSNKGKASRARTRGVQKADHGGGRCSCHGERLCYWRHLERILKFFNAYNIHAGGGRCVPLVFRARKRVKCYGPPKKHRLGLWRASHQSASTD